MLSYPPPYILDGDVAVLFFLFGTMPCLDFLASTNISHSIFVYLDSTMHLHSNSCLYLLYCTYCEACVKGTIKPMLNSCENYRWCKFRCMCANFWTTVSPVCTLKMNEEHCVQIIESEKRFIMVGFWSDRIFFFIIIFYPSSLDLDLSARGELWDRNK